MARVLTCFFRQISWASGIHVEGFFPVYQGRVLPRGRYPLGWVFVHVRNTYLGGFFPVAIPTQVRATETNRVPLLLHLLDTRWVSTLRGWDVPLSPLPTQGAHAVV